MAEIAAGNLYDMNKILVEQKEHPVKGKLLINRLFNVGVPYFKEKLAHDNYFMLLCNDRKDYTVFNVLNNNEKAIEQILNKVKACMDSRGTVYGLDATKDGVALEIWIKCIDNQEMACYYLFPYSNAVIEI